MLERTPKRTVYIAQTIPRLSQNPSSLSGSPACGEWVNPSRWAGPSRKSRCIAYAPSLAQWEPFSGWPSIKSPIFTNQAQWVHPNQRYAVFVCVAVNPSPLSFTAKPTSLGTREDLELINSLTSSPFSQARRHPLSISRKFALANCIMNLVFCLLALWKFTHCTGHFHFPIEEVKMWF